MGRWESIHAQTNKKWESLLIFCKYVRKRNVTMRRAKLKQVSEVNVNEDSHRIKSKVMSSLLKIARPRVGLLVASCLCLFTAVIILIFSVYYKDLIWKDASKEYFLRKSDKMNENIDKDDKKKDGHKDILGKSETNQPSLRHGRFKDGLSFKTAAEDVKKKEELHVQENVDENDKDKNVISESKDKKITPKDSTDNYEIENYFVLLQLVNAQPGSRFADNFYNCIKSIMKRTRLYLKFLLTVDDVSKSTAENIFQDVFAELKVGERPQITYFMIDEINKKVFPYTKKLQELFSSGEGAYYSHAIFFIAPVLHKILPKSIKKLVMLDTDLQFRADIKELFDLFKEMSRNNIMALATDQQPVYRHVLWSYRNKYPQTKVGGPPPDGYTGFNSGVKLMNLEEMRSSKLYDELLKGQNASTLAGKYEFKGHLGDQDFYSLISFEYPDLFYTLPCQWNRQLCTWWKDHGYKDVFDLYFHCKPPYFVFHGNCNTPIPNE